MKRMILLLVFILGCTGIGSPQPNTRVDEDYHSGYGGITMRFIPGNPPTQIYVPDGALTDSYDIMLEIKNEGAYDTSDSHFVLSGYDSSIFVMGDSYFKGVGPIQGRSTDNPVGGIDQIKWTVTRTLLPDGIDRFPQTFMVSACYDYETEASIQVCIDPKPWEYTSREKICRPEHVTVTGGQGAPVAITNVEVTPMNNKVQMKIEIQNMGRGQVVDSSVNIGSIGSRCPFNLDYEDLDKIRLTVMPDIGGLRGSCTPDEINLVNGHAFFYCTFEGINQGGRDDAYLSTLNINFRYKYTESEQTKIDLLAVPG